MDHLEERRDTVRSSSTSSSVFIRFKKEKNIIVQHSKVLSVQKTAAVTVNIDKFNGTNATYKGGPIII